MRADARRNYERLLAEAEALISELGTDAPLEEIARRAELGIGTLYRHFPTREALLEALLRERFDGLRALAEELMNGPDAFESLAEWLRRFILGAGVYRGLAASMVDAIQDESSSLHASCLSMREAAAELLVRAQGAGAVRAEVTPVDVLVMANAVAWAMDRAPGDGEAGERRLSMVLRGMRV
ncbi:TetR/AcrR family transcriptional regulator [Actinomadura barringtoniae]|nr:helix-turn-helix domain containing protein [Actinomadura barringtoniae]